MKYEGMIAETVLIQGHKGDQIDAYLARPLGGGPFGGVVLIHHMPGWDEASKEMARKLAHNGIATISPNLHFREGKATPQENSTSIREAGGMPDDRTMGDVDGAMKYLRTLPYLNGKVGLIGFCSGGRQTYLGACTLSGVDAAVDCWGGGVTQGNDQLTPAQPRWPIEFTDGLNCPLLGLFGDKVGGVIVQAAMLWQADEISQPIADEHRDREYQRQDPQAGDDGDDQNRAMEKQQSTRPQDRVVMFFRLVQMKRPHPLAIRRIDADRCHNRHDQPGNQSASADTAAGKRQQVDSEQLQHECRGQRRFNRQQYFPIALPGARCSDGGRCGCWHSRSGPTSRSS